MFYPGDPFEQRKRQLIAKMAGSRGAGGAGGGFRVGRAAGAGFGRGLGFGTAGGQGQRSVALPQMLAGYGGGLGNSEFGQGAVDSSQFRLGGDVMGPGAFGRETMQAPPAQQFFGGQASPQPAISHALLQQLLGGYGQAPAPVWNQSRMF